MNMDISIRDKSILSFQRGDNISLTWSEHCYVFAIILAAFVTVNPLHLTLPSAIKHLPLLITIPAFILTLVGRHLSMPPDSTFGISRVVSSAWPLAALALFVIVGSLYARLGEGLQTTFLSMGVYMTLLFIAASMVIVSSSPVKLIKAFSTILIWSAVVMGIILVISYGRREVYHEQIFLVIPLGVYCFLAIANRYLAWFGLIFFLACAILSKKNTSYLVSLLVIVYLTALLFLPKFKAAPPIKRIFYAFTLLVAALVGAVAIGFLLYFKEKYLPTGNVEYRSHTYELAWLKFLESPVWGTLFATESVKKFTLYTIGIANNRLPTHSDIMDILGNGGLIGILLWLSGIICIGYKAFKKILAPRFLSNPISVHAHTYSIISIAGVLTYTFNPIMLQQGMSYMLWTTLGFLLGIALQPDLRNKAQSKYIVAGRFA